MTNELLDDIEIGDFVIFRSGGITNITALWYETLMDGVEHVVLEFEGNEHDQWTYLLDGTLDPVGESVLDILQVLTPQEAFELVNGSHSNDN